MEPNKVSIDYCHRWIKCSLKIGERHYTLFLICGLIIYITTFIISAIPFFGSIASIMLTFLYAIAGMRLTQQALQQNAATVDDFFKYTFDSEYFKKFKIQFGILFGLGVISLSSTLIKLTSVLLVSNTVVHLITYLIGFSAFMILQNPTLKWNSALEKVFQGFILNLGPWIMVSVLLVVFAALSLLLCFVPFLLYFVPMTFSVGYLIYSSIFENLNIDTFLADWSKKPPIQTLILPPES